MSAKDVKGQALWRHRGAVIAPLILISLVGLGLVGSAQGGEAPASVLGAQIRVRPTSGPMGTGIRWTYSTTIAVRPRFGPGGTTIMVRGSGFSALYCSIYISFTDAVGTVTTLDTLGPMSSFVVYEVIPLDAA